MNNRRPNVHLPIVVFISQHDTMSSIAPSASISAAAYMTPDVGVASYRESNALLLEARLEYLDAKFNRVQSEIAELQVNPKIMGRKKERKKERKR